MNIQKNLMRCGALLAAVLALAPSALAADAETASVPAVQLIPAVRTVQADWRLLLVNRWNPIPDGYTFELTQLKQGHAMDSRAYPDLQEMMDAQNAKVQQILQSVKDALMGFSSDELSVREENGKIYVAMSDKLLFRSGSATVDERGKEALAKLAEVLNKQTDVDVNIEGHTDTKPIHTARFADNWDLSVIRATSVVRILTEEYHVSPLQIVPSGRGEYVPVADNDSAEGRSKNRRTEIIIAPKLDELLEILN